MQTGKTCCPLCGSNKSSFFARHRDVVQDLYRCNSCGFYFVFPHEPYIPTVTDGKEKHLWCSEEAYKEYELWRSQENQRLSNLIFNDSGKVNKLLEVGFGDGPLTELLLPNITEYWGVEPIPEVCEQTIKALNLDKDKIFCGKAEDIEESDLLSDKKNYFDVIVLISVFEHVGSPRKVLESCKKLLAQDGVLIISTPDSKYFSWLYWLRKIARMEPWSYFHISFFTETNLESTFSTAGLDVIDKSRGPLVTRQSAKYFARYTNSKLVGVCMNLFRILNLDRHLHIDTLCYKLKKTP